MGARKTLQVKAANGEAMHQLPRASSCHQFYGGERNMGPPFHCEVALRRSMGSHLWASAQQ